MQADFQQCSVTLFYPFLFKKNSYVRMYIARQLVQTLASIWRRKSCAHWSHVKTRCLPDKINAVCDDRRAVYFRPTSDPPAGIFRTPWCRGLSVRLSSWQGVDTLLQWRRPVAVITPITMTTHALSAAASDAAQCTHQTRGVEWRELSLSSMSISIASFD